MFFFGILHLVNKQVFLKNYHFLLPDKHTYAHAYQAVRNVSFSENFAYQLNGWCLCNISQYFSRNHWFLKLNWFHNTALSGEILLKNLRKHGLVLNRGQISIYLYKSHYHIAEAFSQIKLFSNLDWKKPISLVVISIRKQMDFKVSSVNHADLHQLVTFRINDHS